MGVADLVAGETTFAVLGEDGMAGETVVDLARGVGRLSPQLLQAERHRTRVPNLHRLADRACKLSGCPGAAAH